MRTEASKLACKQRAAGWLAGGCALIMLRHVCDKTGIQQPLLGCGYRALGASFLRRTGTYFWFVGATAG